MMAETDLDFLRFCADLVPISHAQNFQDLFALWHSDPSRPGWFVEFGALGGINVSNSYTLERLGWSGIVAEPHPGFREQIHANRRCHVSTDCVWTSTGETLQFQVVVGRPALSSIVGLNYDDVQSRTGARDNHVIHDVPTISLLDLLRSFDAPPEIDLLSIDTEGSELPILQAFDFGAYRFGTIVVEHGHSSQRDPIHRLLTGHGYVRVWTGISEHDDWYVHASRIETIMVQRPEYPAMIARLAACDPADGQGERYRRLSRLALTAGSPDLALLCAERAMRLSGGKNAVIAVELGRALLAAGQKVAAARAFHDALAIDPNQPNARAMLQRLTSG
jgi:FkbM family methyltransferase